MKASIALVAAGAATALAQYPGDIVQYWADQGGVLANGSVIGGQQSPVSAWATAVVHGAVYLAATESRGKGLAYQQLAVSHAAHNALIWLYHGSRNFDPTDAAIRRILPQIGLSANSSQGIAATRTGRLAARKVITARADDRINDFVDYVFGPQQPGVYQVTAGGNAYPDTPQARFTKFFASVGNVTQYQISPPPSPSSSQYEADTTRVIAQGERNSTVRKPFDTKTAYFWRESSISQWTRIANGVIGQSLAKDVEASAKYYAQFYYALANAGFAAWYAKYQYNAWRPITAIRYPGVYLSSGRNISDPNWTPLLLTPSHQDYPSTHATFGAAASEVLRTYLGTDRINVTQTSNVTVDGIGPLTRVFTNLTETALQNAESRVFGGIHFDFAADAGIKLGTELARKTLERFDQHWYDF